MESYIELETWFYMLLRLKEKWHKWIFSSEDVMDPTVWPASAIDIEEWRKKEDSFHITPFS